jgi:hypothetical protein
MLRFKTALAIGGAALAFTAPSTVLAQAFDGTQVIQAVGLIDLQQFVIQRGDTVVDTGNNGAVSVLAKTKSGLNYLLVGAACHEPGVVGCGGIFMQVKYTMTPAVTDATLSQANTDYAALKIWKDEANKIVGVSRYVILRNGVTRQNLVDNVDILIRLAPAAARVAYGQAPQKPPSKQNQQDQQAQ